MDKLLSATEAAALSMVIKYYEGGGFVLTSKQFCVVDKEREDGIFYSPERRRHVRINMHNDGTPSSIEARFRCTLSSERDPDIGWYLTQETLHFLDEQEKITRTIHFKTPFRFARLPAER